MRHAGLVGLLLALPVAASAIGAPDPAILSADQAFALLPAERDGRQVVLKWAIAAGYFLYRARIVASAVGLGTGGPSTLSLPKGIVERDPLGIDVEIYRTALRATLAGPAGPAAPRSLRVTYQGCADIGICYPPQTKTVPLPP